MELLSSKSSKATDNQVGKQDYQLSQLMSSFRKLYVQLQGHCQQIQAPVGSTADLHILNIFGEVTF